VSITVTEAPIDVGRQKVKTNKSKTFHVAVDTVAEVILLVDCFFASSRRNAPRNLSDCSSARINLFILLFCKPMMLDLANRAVRSP